MFFWRTPPQSTAAQQPVMPPTTEFYALLACSIASLCACFLELLRLSGMLGDNVVVFHPIDDAQLRRGILERKLRPVREHLQERWGVGLVLPEDVLDHLVERARVEHGGRGLLNAVERELINPMARFLFEVHSKLRRGRSVQVTLEGRLLDFELMDG